MAVFDPICGRFRGWFWPCFGWCWDDFWACVAAAVLNAIGYGLRGAQQVDRYVDLRCEGNSVNESC